MAARQIQDREILFVGTYWPLVSATLAKKLHAPQAIFVFEGGLVCDFLDGPAPLLTTDPRLASSAALCGDCIDALQILQGGHVTRGLLSANAIDRFGNVNTTCVGDYDRPKARLAGSGGASDIMALTRVLVIIEQEKRRFPERVDYITSPGFLGGGTSRELAGMTMDTGPTTVVTTMGVFRFDVQSREMYLAACYAGTDPDKIRSLVQWDLKVAGNLEWLPPPTDDELRVLREEVDPQRVFLR